MNDDYEILRLREVMAKTGQSRSGIYRAVKKGTFPAPLSLGGTRSIGWYRQDIWRWLKSQKRVAV